MRGRVAHILHRSDRDKFARYFASWPTAEDALSGHFGSYQGVSGLPTDMARPSNMTRSCPSPSRAILRFFDSSAGNGLRYLRELGHSDVKTT